MPLNDSVATVGAVSKETPRVPSRVRPPTATATVPPSVPAYVVPPPVLVTTRRVPAPWVSEKPGTEVRLALAIVTSRTTLPSDASAREIVRSPLTVGPPMLPTVRVTSLAPTVRVPAPVSTATSSVPVSANPAGCTCTLAWKVPASPLAPRTSEPDPLFSVSSPAPTVTVAPVNETRVTVAPSSREREIEKPPATVTPATVSVAEEAVNANDRRGRRRVHREREGAGQRGARHRDGDGARQRRCRR